MPPIDTETDVETNDTAAPPSLRDALSQSLETLSEEPAPELEQADSTEPLEGETQEQADQRARDEAGRFAKQPKKSEAKPAAAKPLVKPAPKVEVKPGVKPPDVVKPLVGGKPVPTSAQTTALEMKAPQAWREPAKQVWATLPEAARVEVLRREKEIAGQLATVGEERKYASAMKQAFAPFEAQIRAEGSTPEKTIGNLMSTALALRTAPPAHKAALVAQIITDYGVPLQGLVHALQGKAPLEEQHQTPAHVDRAEIVKQVREDLMKDLGSRRDQALQAKVQGEIDTFLQDKPMHGIDGTDYSEVIQATMADLIDAARNRKSTLTLDQAYTLAARMHPEVSKVLERKDLAAKAAKANASTQRARAASSSVRHSPTTQPVSTAKGGSLREHLEQAAEQLE